MNHDHLEAVGVLLVLAGLTLIAWAAYLITPEAGYAVAGIGLAACGALAVRAANTRPATLTRDGE